MKNKSVTSQLTAVGKLGREIKISPKAKIDLNSPGYSVRYHVETVSILIGIGKDHTADLTMDIESWQALNSGETIHITTVKDFKNNKLTR